MDPFSALSISAAAVQFIEFACKLVCKSKELYETIDGVTCDIEDTETVTTRLRGLSKDVKDGIPLARNSGHERLCQICDDCEQVSRTLCDRISRIRVSSWHSNRKWKSFRQALKCVWNKSELDSMAQRLASLRMELDTQTLALLNDGVGNLSLQGKADAASMSNKTDTAVVQLSEALKSTQDQIVHHINTMDNRSRGLLKNLTRAIIRQGNDRNATHAEAYKTLLSNIRECNAAWYNRREMPEAERRDQTLQHQAQREALVTDDLAKTKRRVEVAILESLRFPEMGLRFETVPETHRNTFKWVFRDPSSHGEAWDDFADWLSNGRGVYWICSKAASGKSSLMGFLVQEPTTSTLLEKWSKGNRLQILKFFFWNSGTEEQRSQLGLFRTLAFEILDKRRDLIPQAFPTDWERHINQVSHDIAPVLATWSLARVVQGFKKSLSIACQEQSFCLFIDGLDEYAGDPSDAAEIINQLAEISPRVKLCVSSRPLAEFQSMFSPYPSLRLQDLTEDDIRTYVSDKLDHDRSIGQTLTHGSPDAIEISQYIVRTASGVFLWVVLVVKALLKGARNGDSVAQLKAYLFSLPADIELLFEHMLAKVDRQYREEGARIFMLFRAGGYRLDVLTLHWVLLHNDVDSALKMPIDATRGRNETGYEQIINRMKLIVSSRTLGLLEVQGGITSRYGKSEFPSQKMPNVNFIHQTARNYLERPDVWETIVSQAQKSQFNLLRAHLQGAISFLKATLFGHLDVIGIEILKHISGIDAPIPNEGVLLLEELDRVLLWRSKSLGFGDYWQSTEPKDDDKRTHWPQNMCEMSVHCGIAWYAASRMDAKRASISMQRPKEGFSARKTFRASTGRPPLMLFALGFSQNINLAHPSWRVQNNILEPILRHGGHPNDSFGGHTLWEYTISWTHVMAGEIAEQPERVADIIKTIRLMLDHGADPNVCCIRSEQTIDPTRPELRTTGIYKPLNKHAPVATMEKRYLQEHSLPVILTDLGLRSKSSNRGELSALLDVVERCRARWSKKRPREEQEPAIIEIGSHSPDDHTPTAGYSAKRCKKGTKRRVPQGVEIIEILDDTSDDQQTPGYNSFSSLGQEDTEGNRSGIDGHTIRQPLWLGSYWTPTCGSEPG
ncbi:hypothetical protein PG991_010236 [Apiospora marii]|uniref:NACHT domain-containing protein n=1 Tax=Apiospora marii TaxID=335849 RepID=A0ABR1RJ17_9PEZI